MSTLTKEWLLKTIAELEEERDAVPGVVNEDAARALAAMKLALASLEAEHAGFIVKHKVTGKFGSWLHSKADWFRSDEYEVLSAYTAPPAPASVPDVVSWEDVPEEITEDDIALASAWAHGFNQCRAAMLQGAENAESPTTMQTAPSLDSSQIIAEPPSGNSPVIPDGWVACSERMPEKADEVLCAKEFDGPGDWRQKVGYYLSGKWTVYSASWTPTHWMPLPAAPH
ncbi:DUF551 domain-containing protein [Escherichia coli]|uniref:DUF551 domain-containing protein n=1 Tax=Escherichia coli TaxID=562 RepID=UPI000DD903E4|nr:DUF551 domain-containing protein [Escherichia coli]EFD5251653.1 DUF551 domain-containing protein [Escherichia coli]EIX8981426.1 DUF551 domain-containing protein [Escherichia coli]ELC6205814.1 DUF551 domain-containing protein [Escherichia coli]EMD3258773.1 DUF551 domain-containing protein [Escherichia coli]MBW4286481.1 DUF551 domain-containing protein [Escherichia coli]